MGILTSLHGRLAGLNKNGALVVPGGFLTADQEDPIITSGGGLAGTGTVIRAEQAKIGSRWLTQIFIDLTGLASIATDGDAIGAASGEAASLPAYLAQITAAKHGAPCFGRMVCLEVPAGGLADIDLAINASGAIAKDGAVVSGGTAIVTSGGSWTAGAEKKFASLVTANAYLYLCSGASSGAGTYTAGRFLIELEGSVFEGT